MTYNLTGLENANSKLMRAVLILAIGAVVAFANASTANAGPTFSCKKTYSKTERAICNDAELGKLDRQMSREYKFLYRSMKYKQKRELKKDQRQWLKVRNRCGSRSSCISDQYYFRIAELVEWNMP